MQLKWPNIIALAVAILALILLINVRPHEIGLMLTPWRSHVYFISTEDRIMGLLSLALICVTLVAIVKILAGRGGKGKP